MFGGVHGLAADTAAAEHTLAAALAREGRSWSRRAGPLLLAATGDPPPGDAVEIVTGTPLGSTRELAGLRGRFALARAAADGTLELAVDQLGAGSLFLADDGSSLWFATELRILLRLLPRRPAPDEAAVARRLVDGLVPRGRTLFEGVRRLEAGHVVVVEPGGRRRERAYWSPAYRPPPRLDLAAAAGSVLDAATEAVARRLPASDDERTAILLSGGLDSSSVAALARRARPQLALGAWSAVFPSHPEIDEAQLVAVTAERLAVPSRTVAVHGGGALATSLEYLRDWELPSVSPNLFFQRPLLASVREAGARIVLDGQGGDELFGLAAFLPADRLRRGDVPQALRLARRLSGAAGSPKDVLRLLRVFGLGGLAPSWARRSRRPGLRPRPDWLLPRLGKLQAAADDADAWRDGDGPLWWRELVNDVVVQRERMEVHDYLRRKDTDSGTVGAHPFLDDLDLIETVLSLPPELAYTGSLDRPVLREAVAGLIPDEIRLRPVKSWFDRLFVEALEADLPRIGELISSKDSLLRGYVRQDLVAERLLRAPEHARGGRWAWLVWRLATVECWLRAQSEPAFAEQALGTWKLAAPRVEA